ncbi:MAG TPA: chemotaxis-specific protein-glutamate methyltransferase CheB [Gemmataceae bacterium]|nr:chemotaxis-specific protein-glutamate methyltransferase CheB [Gemmataceae bacterium]
MRVAIVNDLALAREVLRRVVLSVPGYSVAWVAEDGDEAVRRAAADRPDAILMDLIMPRLDGAEATRRIMRDSPCPIVLVTATKTGNFDLVFQGMAAGAQDVIETPTLGPGGSVVNAEPLLRQMRKLADGQRGVKGSGYMPVVSVGEPAANLPPLVAIGASTGGPDALHHVLSTLPADFPAAVVVAQHIEAAFAPGLAAQLAARCKLPVRVAKDGEPPAAGVVLIAGSNDHLELGADRLLRYTAHPRTYPYRPSVEVLFSSAAAHSSRLGVGVLLTGMGTDGADGLLKLRAAGWHTIAQDEATSVVYGMPKAAVERRAAVDVLPLPLIGPAVARHFAGR